MNALGWGRTECRKMRKEQRGDAVTASGRTDSQLDLGASFLPIIYSETSPALLTLAFIASHLGGVTVWTVHIQQHGNGTEVA